MHYIYGRSGPSLHIESTDSVIRRGREVGVALAKNVPKSKLEIKFIKNRGMNFTTTKQCRVLNY